MIRTKLDGQLNSAQKRIRSYELSISIQTLRFSRALMNLRKQALGADSLAFAEACLGRGFLLRVLTAGDIQAGTPWERSKMIYRLPLIRFFHSITKPITQVFWTSITRLIQNNTISASPVSVTQTASPGTLLRVFQVNVEKREPSSASHEDSRQSAITPQASSVRVADQTSHILVTSKEKLSYYLPARIVAGPSTPASAVALVSVRPQRLVEHNRDDWMPRASDAETARVFPEAARGANFHKTNYRHLLSTQILKAAEPKAVPFIFYNRSEFSRTDSAEAGRPASLSSLDYDALDAPRDVVEKSILTQRRQVAKKSIAETSLFVEPFPRNARAERQQVLPLTGLLQSVRDRLLSQDFLTVSTSMSFSKSTDHKSFRNQRSDGLKPVQDCFHPESSRQILAAYGMFPHQRYETGAGQLHSTISMTEEVMSSVQTLWSHNRESTGEMAIADRKDFVGERLYRQPILTMTKQPVLAMTQHRSAPFVAPVVEPAMVKLEEGVVDSAVEMHDRSVSSGRVLRSNVLPPQTNMLKSSSVNYVYAQPFSAHAEERQVIKHVDQKEVVDIVHKEMQTLKPGGSVIESLRRHDYLQIADQVYTVLARRLTAEKERIGRIN